MRNIGYEFLFYQKSIFYFIIITIILNACINIAPAETWDDDDTRIWINEASGLNLDPFWFKEDTTAIKQTLLIYKEEFEQAIDEQIQHSWSFNSENKFDLSEQTKPSQDSIKGIWKFVDNGYQFFQFKGNQYPMSITIDTSKNWISIINMN